MKMTFEEVLEREGRLVYTNVGISMLPLLRQGKDLFVVEKRGPERLRAGDVVLYRRPPNQYVLHRIVEVREREYVILGDNCVNREYGITDGDILGILTGVVRDGKLHTVTEKWYRLYSFFMVHGADVRIFFKRAVAYGKAGIKKLLGIRRTAA
ncbi:MAG: S26 family signal peptidase [Clostridia bacterium]|nr:S26 family signal peptidase [Clostridia bacterium]MBR0205900.1 S26 family signal peptidase [Clostridia bacterium]